ncbi:MAG: hypothetical protein QRY72_03620 [Candidatus Rhabdochlamydia sp.]
MTSTCYQLIRDYTVLYPKSPIDKLCSHVDFKNKIDLIARFWMSKFGFFYIESLQIGSLSHLKKKVLGLQQEALGAYQAYENGRFDEWIKRILADASYYRGDDIGQIRQKKLSSLSYLPLTLGYLAPLKADHEQDREIFTGIEQKDLACYHLLCQKWDVQTYPFSAFTTEEQEMIEGYLFSKASLIWDKKLYNWYQLVSLWMTLQGENTSDSLDHLLSLKNLLINPEDGLLQKELLSKIEKHKPLLIPLSFQQFIVELSIKSIAEGLKAQLSHLLKQKLTEDFIQHEALRQQALLHAYQMQKESQGHFWKSMEMFIHLRNRLTESLVTEGSPFEYDQLLGWIYLSSDGIGNPQFDQFKPGQLRFIFDVIKEWEEKIALSSEDCFFVFKLAAYNEDFIPLVQQIRQVVKHKNCRHFRVTPAWVMNLLQLKSRRPLKEAFEGVIALDTWLQQAQVPSDQTLETLWILPFIEQEIRFQVEGLKQFFASLGEHQEKLDTIDEKGLESLLKSAEKMASFSHQMTLSFPLSFNEKMKIAQVYLHTDADKRLLLMLEIERVIQSLRHSFAIDNNFLKCLFLHLMNLSYPEISEQLAYLEKLQKLIGTELSDVSTYVWLAFCPNLSKMNEVIDTFVKGCEQIADQINEPALNNDTVELLYTHLGNLVNIPSSYPQWRKNEKCFFNALDQACLEPLSDEWKNLVSLGLNFASHPMLAEVMTLLTYAIFPMSGHLFVADFMRTAAFINESFIIGEEDKKTVTNSCFLPLLEQMPDWRGIHREWKIPLNEEGYPIFSLTLIDFRTGCSPLIQEEIPLPWHVLREDKALVEQLQEIAELIGSEMQGSVPSTHTLKGAYASIFQTFISQLKLKLRAALFWLNPSFRHYLPAKYPLILDLNRYSISEDLIKYLENAVLEGLDQNSIQEVHYQGVSCSWKLFLPEKASGKEDDISYWEIILKMNTASQRMCYPQDVLQRRSGQLIRLQLCLLQHQINPIDDGF